MKEGRGRFRDRGWVIFEGQKEKLKNKKGKTQHSTLL